MIKTKSIFLSLPKPWQTPINRSIDRERDPL